MQKFLPVHAIAASTCDSRVAALVDGRLVTHAEFRRHVAAWRDVFAARAGKNWALYFDDGLAFAAALFGAWHADKYVYLCSDNLPATLLSMRGRVDGYAGDLPAEFEPLTPPDPYQVDPPDWSPLDVERTGLAVYTSGSTGDPVALDKRLRQLGEEVRALESRFAEVCDVDAAPEATAVYGTVSHQHIYGLLFRVLWPLAAGRPFGSRLFFYEQLSHALGQGHSVLVTSPAHLKRLPVEVDWSSARARLRAVFSSGGALDEDAAAHACATLGMEAIEIYGSSETGGIASRRRSGMATWKPLPGVEWNLVEGRLEVRSPFLADAQWFRSEDLAESDGAGGFRLVGRGDRIVKFEERRVSLTALDAAISANTAVEDARVLVLTGARTELAAVVVPSADGWSRLESEGRWRFTQMLKSSLASSHDATLQPQRWRYVSALPVNAQGKVTQHALRDLFELTSP
ncbi:AMP-binding protein [Xanthomonas bonasiae]|uniref:AMP-binding protein n=1 Tax=Xanthomonas bonasiae TaxID=2810351 RepID=UPI00197F4302|nr:AMP-binding protein [Xanthomonas bonasiae]MBN6111413.1 acyl-CoA synthetase [Xanthomonas bonasiae]